MSRNTPVDPALRRASGLNLVVAAITLWNTVYLERGASLLGRSQKIDLTLLQHVSPLSWEHVGLTGDCLGRTDKRLAKAGIALSARPPPGSPASGAGHSTSRVPVFCHLWRLSPARRLPSRKPLLNLALRSRVVLYVMYNAMHFEWDAEKNRTNQTKHSGVDFETASRVFADPDLILRKDRGDRRRAALACDWWSSQSRIARGTCLP